MPKSTVTRPKPQLTRRPEAENLGDGAQLSAPAGVSSSVSSIAPAGQHLDVGDERAPAAAAVLATAQMASLDDTALMLRVKAGDEAAFAELVERFRRPMIAFMYRMAHNQAVAEELAQEVFLRVYRSRSSYAADAKFTTWLYRIATNVAVNHARDTRQERTADTVCLDEPDEETGTTVDVADKGLTAEQDLLRQERLAAIRQHVMALPERQRMAVLMHKYQDLDYKQIAKVLKLSESATKSLLFRAYESLREKLQAFV